MFGACLSELSNYNKIFFKTFDNLHFLDYDLVSTKVNYAKQTKNVKLYQLKISMYTNVICIYVVDINIKYICKYIIEQQLRKVSL